jgi:hypothetical protein
MEDRYGLVPLDIRARYEREEFVDRAVHAGRSLEGELKSAFGPEMEVVLVRHDIDPEALPDNAVAGHWHVRRANPAPELPTYIPILGPGGTYRDPDQQVVSELYERDLRRPEVRQKFLDETRTDQPHKKKERALHKEQRLDVMKEDFRAAKRVRGEGGLKKSFEKKRGKDA